MRGTNHAHHPPAHQALIVLISSARQLPRAPQLAARAVARTMIVGPVFDPACAALEERLQTSLDYETLADIAQGADPEPEGGEASADGTPGDDDEVEGARLRAGARVNGVRVVAADVTLARRASTNASFFQMYCRSRARRRPSFAPRRIPCGQKSG